MRMGKINKVGNSKCWRGWGEREPSCTVGGNVNWCSHSGKLRVLEELEIDLPCDPAVALLGIYPRDADAVKRRDTCPPMFLAAMSTIAKLWKEPRCPSKDEWIKKMWSMYTMEYSSAIRNDKYPPFASTGIDLEGVMLSEVSQSIGGQTLYGLIHLGIIRNS